MDTVCEKPGFTEREDKHGSNIHRANKKGYILLLSSTTCGPADGVWLTTPGVVA